MILIFLAFAPLQLLTAHVLSFAFFASPSLPLPSCVTKPSLLSGVSFALAHVSGAACT